MELMVLGSRGSIPVGGQNFNKYGAETSSYLVLTDKEAIFLDAGTGIMNAPEVEGRNISIILSHFHADHLLGLAFFPYFQKDIKITFYSAFPAEEMKLAIDKLFSPPLWPCRITDFKAQLEFCQLADATQIGDAKVEYIWGNHPGKAAIIGVSVDDKKVVYATDFEAEEGASNRLIEFANKADLLLYDGQYTKEECDMRKGYGHSTIETGIQVGERAKVKQMIFIHHDPAHTDDMLDDLYTTYEAVAAKSGEVIKL